MLHDIQRQGTFSPTCRGCYRSYSILIWVTCVRWLLGLLLGRWLFGWRRQSEKFGDWYSLNWGDRLDVKVNFGWLVRLGVRGFVIILLMELVRRQATSKSVTRDMNRIFILSILCGWFTCIRADNGPPTTNKDDLNSLNLTRFASAFC